MMPLRQAAMAITMTSKTLGVALPEAVSEALEQATARTEAYTITPPSTPEFAVAIAAAVKANRDPAADPAVQALCTRHELVTLRINARIAEHLAEMGAEALQANIAEIVEGWREALTADGEILWDAVNLIGNSATLDAPPRNPPPRIAEAWARARGSAARFDAAAIGFWLAAEIAGIALNPHRRACVLAAVSLEQIRKLTIRPAVWDLVCVGAQPDLATFQSWTQRNQAIEAEIAAGDAEVEDQVAAMTRRANRGFEPGSLMTHPEPRRAVVLD